MSALERFRKGPPEVRAESSTVESVSGRARGQCPHCLLMFTLNPVSGTLRSHLAPVRQEGLPYRETLCPGAGGWPRPKRPLWR